MSPAPSNDTQTQTQTKSDLKPTLKVALALDAAELLARGFEYFDDFGADFATPEIASCSSDKKWETGQTLKEAISSANFEGITGPISFSHGERFRLEVQLLKLKYNQMQAPDLVSIGNWTTGTFSENEGLAISDTSLLLNDEPQVNKTLIVTTLPGSACVEKSEDGKLQGFCVDVLDEIAKVAGFQFKLKSVADGKYGMKDSALGTWNGMIGEVMRGEADLAMADLTVTAVREEAVDFAASFMHTELVVLYKNFEASGQQLSTLLSPFSLWVWVSIGLAFVVTSVCLRIVAWLSPFQKDDIILPGTTEHHPSLGQDLSWLNSMWLLASTLVLRGSDVRIQAVSSRTVTVVWWLFSLLTLIIYASLVSHWFDPGSMPTAYTVEQLLQRNPNLEVGVIGGGSSQKYLQHSERNDLQKVWWRIQKTPEVRAFVPSLNVGIDAVKRGGGKYAFVGEDQAFKEALNSDCSLNMVSGLDTRSFAPAVAKGSDLRSKITKAILTLRENGKLHQLESKWWSPRACVDVGGRPQVQMMNFIGPLTLLVFGMVVALLIAMVERICYHRRSHRGFFRTSNGEAGNGKIAINQIDTEST